MTSAPLLRDVFDIPPVVAAHDFVLQLQDGVEQPERTIRDYVITPSLAEAFDQALGLAESGLSRGEDRGIFLHGDFGSGKSHFMAVLDLLLRGEPAARSTSGLQQVVADNETVLSRNLLTVEYHLIGAESLEQALFSGYRNRVRQLHPEDPLPLLHKSEHLFADAARMRERDEASFFEHLNSGSNGSGGWGARATGWDAAAYDAAVASPTGDSDRQRLISDLVATMFSGYQEAGQWLDIGEGLQVMAQHAKSIGYEGVVLFLDELVLWLASRLADQDFVSREGAKVAKLVESGVGHRAIPLISFVARQRELQDFYTDTPGMGGAERMAVGDTFHWWKGRFDTVTLQSSNLPDIAQRRLLTPRSPEAAAQVQRAVLALKAHQRTWDVLLRDEAGSDEQAFAKVYPFSPALVDALMYLSGLLQRERTALKVMAQLLSQGRDTRSIDQIIPVADLFDALVLSGSEPLTETVRARFAVARALYLDRFRPVLLASHGLTEPETAALDPSHPFLGDDRLAKTLLISSLVDVPALKDLTASKLAALNHGSVKAFIPGAEATAVLTKVRPWAQQLGELEIGDGPDPVVSLVLSGVDYESILQRVEGEDRPGARRSWIRRMLHEQFGVAEASNLFGSVVSFPVSWRGTKRTIELRFGNIRDEESMPVDDFRPEGDNWRVVVDYPFDEGGHVPMDDVNRFTELREAGLESRTVGWAPNFLSAERQRDLGKLVVLEHLLGGTGDQFEANARHLPVEQRPQAKTLLENRRKALRNQLIEALRQAYGLAAKNAANVDLSMGDFEMWPTLDSDIQVQAPVAASLGDALRNLADQMLSTQYPDHPRFEADVRPRDLSLVLDFVGKAMANPQGRVDPVESSARPKLRRVANPLGCGQCYEAHYVFNAETFTWRNEFIRLATQHKQGLSVKTIREALSDRGLTPETENLLIAAWALLEDKQFLLNDAPIQVTSLSQIKSHLVLVDPQLPSEADWVRASRCATTLFGASVAPLLSAANLTALAAGVREQAGRRSGACGELVAELQRHADVLGLTETDSRLQSARSAAEFVAPLAGESDDLALAGRLAGFPLPAEPQPLAKSISSAQTVVDTLGRTNWGLLEAVAGSEDPAAVAVVAKLRETAVQHELHAPLSAALGRAESQATSYLAGQRRTGSGGAGVGVGGEGPGGGAGGPGSGTGGGGVGAGGAGDGEEGIGSTGGPGGSGGVGAGQSGSGDGDGRATHPNQITIEGLDEGLQSGLDQIAAKVRAESAQHPGKKLNLRWWWE